MILRTGSRATPAAAAGAMHTAPPLLRGPSSKQAQWPVGLCKLSCRCPMLRETAHAVRRGPSNRIGSLVHCWNRPVAEQTGFPPWTTLISEGADRDKGQRTPPRGTSFRRYVSPGSAFSRAAVHPSAAPLQEHGRLTARPVVRICERGRPQAIAPFVCSGGAAGAVRNGRAGADGRFQPARSDGREAVSSGGEGGHAGPRARGGAGSKTAGSEGQNPPPKRGLRGRGEHRRRKKGARCSHRHWGDSSQNGALSLPSPPCSAPPTQADICPLERRPSDHSHGVSGQQQGRGSG